MLRAATAAFVLAGVLVAPAQGETLPVPKPDPPLNRQIYVAKSAEDPIRSAIVDMIVRPGKRSARVVVSVTLEVTKPYDFEVGAEAYSRGAKWPWVDAGNADVVVNDRNHWSISEGLNVLWRFNPGKHTKTWAWTEHARHVRLGKKYSTQYGPDWVNIKHWPRRRSVIDHVILNAAIRGSTGHDFEEVKVER